MLKKASNLDSQWVGPIMAEVVRRAEKGNGTTEKSKE